VPLGVCSCEVTPDEVQFETCELGAAEEWRMASHNPAIRIDRNLYLDLTTASRSKL